MHVFDRVDGNAYAPDFTQRARCVGIDAHLRRQIECHRQAGLTGREEHFVARI